ncbi:MAG: hypothetical protein M0P41_04815 [Sphaerochaeta sp.]|nr:hypothetical protein [Sphaerochaeta sp.]
MAVYDDYHYKLYSDAPQSVFAVYLPKDLQWADELTWNAVAQSVEYSLTGALLIQEGVKQKGRTITLSGLDNMAWITREVGSTLLSMANTPGLVMTLEFKHKTNLEDVLFSYNVMFRHFEAPAVDIKRILQWDQYEEGAYYIVNSIKLMETTAYGA